jgi:Nucleotidyl transferase AbiEii toxin, Type IV TA system
VLDPLQERVARIALALPGAEGLALAGGGAMLAHELVDRPTQDVDMFTTDEDVAVLADTLVAALQNTGLLVVVEARSTTYIRLTVTEDSGLACKVELARDARIRPPVLLDVGAVLHPEEIAADKVLALFGRAAARDFVDVAALLQRFPAERLLDLAAEKDPGFDRLHFAAALHSVARFEDSDFAAFGLLTADVAVLRDQALAWAGRLETEGRTP